MSEEINNTEENPIDKQKLAKKYSRIKQIISVIETIIFFAIILVLLFTGLSKELEKIAFSYTSNNYLALLIFLGIIGIFESIVTFPLSFYSGYILEHKYKLSNQTLFRHFKEKFKGLLVGAVIGIPLILVFFFILQTYENYWWVILGVFMFFISVIMGRLAPVLIFPIFYKFKPIENESLSARIMNLCKKTGVKIQGIFTFDMSKNTKKANAAFTGLGKSKRIILGDTLIDKFSEDEIESVFAHEMGHYSKKHVLKLIISSTVLSFLGLYITSVLYVNSLSIFGFMNISEIAALPLLFLYLSLYGLITSPLSNMQSRKYEWEADTYALQTTGNKEAFISAMEKLAAQNLSDKTPNKIIEFLFHSHPSLEKRIEFAKSFKQ